MSTTKQNKTCFCRFCSMLMASVAILCLSNACFGASFYESSGQTSVFTFAAGSKSGPLAIRNGRVTQFLNANPITISSVKRNVISFSLQLKGSCEIALYDISGRLAFLRRGFDGTSLSLDTRIFGSGLYTVVVRQNGQSFSRRITISR